MKPNVAIVGAGPAGLMAAEILSRAGAGVTVFDHMPSVGRKFLMAGRGGLNLTHSEPMPPFRARYGSAAASLSAALDRLPPAALVDWCKSLGQDVFVGSSGRVFPTSMKASPLLRAWLRRLEAQSVQFALRHRWMGWDADGSLTFETPEGDLGVKSDATILALGGASWPRLGSDGAWTTLLDRDGSRVTPLKPANCGVLAHWSPLFAERCQGQPLKSVSITFAEREARGDVVITAGGLEGGPVYALSAPIRETILDQGEAVLQMALRPDIAPTALIQRLSRRLPKQSLSTALKRILGLAPAAIALLNESALASGIPVAALPNDRLAAFINAVPITLVGLASLDRAISTAGGLGFDALDPSFMLKRRPGTFAAGEMLDWEAPTGGYLLQACFATGVAAAEGAARWLALPLDAATLSRDRTERAGRAPRG